MYNHIKAISRKKLAKLIEDTIFNSSSQSFRMQAKDNSIKLLSYICLEEAINHFYLSGDSETVIHQLHNEERTEVYSDSKLVNELHNLKLAIFQSDDSIEDINQITYDLISFIEYQMRST